jgi:hypothetical protein
MVSAPAYPIRNGALKEELAHTAITIAFAQAAKIDVEEVEIDEIQMQNLLDSILPKDFPDVGLMLHYVLFNEDATPADLLIFTFLSLVLETATADSFELANLLYVFAAQDPVELEEMLNIEPEVEEELDPSDSNVIANRVLRSLIRYCLTFWNAVRADVGVEFGPEDNTFPYILAWVTTLYLQNLGQLNGEETELVTEKANSAVSKQTRLEMEANDRKILNESAIDTANKVLAIEKFIALDAEFVSKESAETFNVSIGFPDSKYTLEELVAPLEMQQRAEEMFETQQAENTGADEVVDALFDCAAVVITFAVGIACDIINGITDDSFIIHPTTTTAPTITPTTTKPATTTQTATTKPPATTKANVAVTGIEVKSSGGRTLSAASPLHVYVGQTTTVTVTVLPSNATNKTYSWDNSKLNSGIATRSNLTFTGQSEGTTGTTVLTASNAKYASFNIIAVTPYANLMSGKMLSAQALRYGPASTYGSAGTIGTNETVTILGSYGAWFYIKAVAGAWVFVPKSSVGILLYAGDIHRGEFPTDMTYNSRTSTQILQQQSTVSQSDINMTADILAEHFDDLARYTSIGDMQVVCRNLVNRFIGGTGSAYSSMILTEEVKANSKTLDLARDFLTSFNQALNRNNGNVSTVIENNSQKIKDALNGNGFVISAYSYGLSGVLNGLTFSINSWTKINVYLKGNYEYGNGTVAGTLYLEYEDNFGLDHGDLEDTLAGIKYGNLPLAGIGFRSWYLLQHNKQWNGAYKPFHTRVSLQLDATTRTFN